MIKIFVDSGSNFTEELLKKYNIDYLSMLCTHNDELLESRLEWDLYTPESMNVELQKGKLLDVGQPSIGDWIEQIKPYLDYDIVYISMSKSLSGGPKCFNMIKNLLHPINRFEVVEVNGASSAVELIATEILDNINELTTVDDILNKVKELNNKLQYFIISESLKTWSVTGRGSDKKTVDYPLGYPLLKGQNDGSIKPIFLGKTYLESLDRLKTLIQADKIYKCVFNYTYDTYPWLIKEIKDMLNELNCPIKYENYHAPTIVCVQGLNAIDVSFI